MVVEVDPYSAVGGALTSGGILLLVVRWMMNRHGLMEDWMRAWVEKESQAKLELARALILLQETARLIVDRVDKLEKKNG